MQLTKNFSLNEFLKSNTATRMGIGEQFAPPQFVLDNIDNLAQQLQVARDYFGEPMVFSSGYRCKRLNTAVGGVANSAHTSGSAVDIEFHSEAQAKKLIEALIKAGFKRIGLGWSFIHVDIDHTKPHPACWLYGSKTPAWLAAMEKSIEARIK
jgi:zinc D-Ala-D-Ala carboxypeptidase